MDKMNRRTLMYAALLLAMVLALAGLSSRLRAENSNKTVALITEYKDIASLAYQGSGRPDAVWSDIRKLGVMGMAVSEYTGDELAALNPLPLCFGSASLLLDAAEAESFPSRAVLRYPTELSYADVLYKYIKTKLPDSELIAGPEYNIILLPGTVEEFKFSAFVPDVAALEFASANDIPVLFRPGPCTPASGRNVADAFLFLTERFPLIRNIIPAGMIVPGYPEIGPLAAVMRDRGITLSQVEFIKQIGVPQLAAKVGRLVIPMHSLTRDEIISRNINRGSIADRFIRAVHERSIRFIMVHPYDLQMGGRLEIFTQDLGVYKKALEARGYHLGWPAPLPSWPAPAAGAAACGLVIVFTLWSYVSRLTDRKNAGVKPAQLFVLFAAAFLLGGAMWKVSFAAKLLGGLCGALAATEGALTALESADRRVRGAVAGLLIVIAGGLAIASFYGTSAAALRLTPFSGVKLTLLAPPLLLLFHDLTRRVHPEAIGEIAVRPAIWGELVLIGVMLLALLVMALRSDNVSNVPALEVAFRDFMERVMVVRPRTKEFLIGYPALVLYWYLVRNEYIPRYREAVRIAAALAFCSAVNTFCHFHTLLYLSVIRVLNGWWLGLLLGAAGVAALHLAVIPLWRRVAKSL